MSSDNVDRDFLSQIYIAGDIHAICWLFDDQFYNLCSIIVGGEEESGENEQEYGREDYRRTEGFSNCATGYGPII